VTVIGGLARDDLYPGLSLFHWADFMASTSSAMVPTRPRRTHHPLSRRWALYEVPPAMESTIVVVHPELDEQRKIAEALEPPNHPLKCALDLRAVIAFSRLPESPS
jgi:hypothetical protein